MNPEKTQEPWRVSPAEVREKLAELSELLVGDGRTPGFAERLRTLEAGHAERKRAIWLLWGSVIALLVSMLRDFVLVVLRS